MPAEKGSAFLLKVGDGAEPPVYATIAGLRTTQLTINGDAVVITNKGSGVWRELLRRPIRKSRIMRHLSLWMRFCIRWSRGWRQLRRHYPYTMPANAGLSTIRLQIVLPGKKAIWPIGRAVPGDLLSLYLECASGIGQEGT